MSPTQQAQVEEIYATDFLQRFWHHGFAATRRFNSSNQFSTTLICGGPCSLSASWSIKNRWLLEETS
jgi:hypothetical protein